MTVVMVRPLMRTSRVAPESPSSGSAASVELKMTRDFLSKASTKSSYSRTILWRATAVTTSSAFSFPVWRIHETTVSSTSNGTLFFKRQRKSGKASSARRGKTSKGRINTRTTGSGISKARGAPRGGTRFKTLRSAVRTASGWITFASTGEAITAPTGNGSTACFSRCAPTLDHCAAATCVDEISTTSDGCGIALNQRSIRRTGPRLKNCVPRLGELVKESHLIDFAQGGYTRADFGQTRITQEGHAFFARHALNFRRGPAVDNHFADVVRQIEQLGDGRTTAESTAGTLQTASAFIEDHVGPFRRIQRRFLQYFRRIMHLLLATFADHPYQALGHDAVQGGNEVIGFDTHVDETPDHVGHVVGVHRGEHQVAGQRGIDGDLRGFLVADFADHDLVRVMAQNRTQAARKRQALFFDF